MTGITATATKKLFDYSLHQTQTNNSIKIFFYLEKLAAKILFPLDDAYLFLLQLPEQNLKCNKFQTNYTGSIYIKHKLFLSLFVYIYCFIIMSVVKEMALLSTEYCLH